MIIRRAKYDELVKLVSHSQAAIAEKRLRILSLESGIRQRKQAIANLEECRVFERETERLLVEGLEKIWNMFSTRNAASRMAKHILDEHAERMGPRPSE